MAHASYLQTSFLGGKWSASAQGRAEEDGYRTALNESFNAVPIETGAHTRRPGTTAPAPTRFGKPGILREFRFSQDSPFNVEFTDGHIRLWAGTGLLLEFPHTIMSISTASPAVISVPLVGSDWAAGDEIEIIATPSNSQPPSNIAPLLSRTFLLTAVDATHFSLSDPVTGLPLDGSTLTTVGWTFSGSKVVTFTTPYVFGTAWSTTPLRLVQDQDVAFILVPGFPPWTLVNTGTDSAPVFNWTQPTFLDGPYLDPPVDGSTLTPSATSGAITLTASAITSINGGAGFKVTDVGRMIRLFSEPLNWSATTTYTKGQPVRFETGAGPAYYQAIVSSKGVQPDLDNGTNWEISTTAAAWTWGLITAFTDTQHVVVTLQPSSIDLYQQPLAGGNLLYTNPIAVWRLGSWSTTTGWPTCGGFHQTRFWFAGAVKNAFDATMSQQNYNFAPTLLDGTVADNNGLSETIKAGARNTIHAIRSTAEGALLFTQEGEWLIQASSQNEPITPTSVKADPATRFGSANVDPVGTGLTYVFVHRFAKKVYEYLADNYSRKFQGFNIALKARDLCAPGIVELAYTAENAPILWARTAQNQLLSCTYKREKGFTSAPADFNGWAHHSLGSGRNVESITGGPSPDGTIDTLAMITVDTVKQIRYVEFGTPIFEDGDIIENAWFLDGAVTPTGAAVIGSNIVFYGLDYLIGDTLTVSIAGIDGGDYVVSAAGTVTVPIDGSANPLLTAATLASLSAGSYTFVVNIQVAPPGGGAFSPVGSLKGYSSASVAPNGLVPWGNGVFDWANKRLYTLVAAAGGDPQTGGNTLFAYDVSAPSTITNALWQANPGQYGIDGTAVAGYDGNLYCLGNGATQCGIDRFNVTTRATDISTGLTTVEPLGYIAPLQVAGAQYVFGTSITSGAISSRWYVFNMTGAPAPVYTGFHGLFDEFPGSLAPGNALPALRGPQGQVFMVVNGQTNGAGASQMGLYKLVVEGPSLAAMVKVGVVTPTAVAGGLTSVNAMFVPIYDETDGNLIIQTVGSDGVNRLIKVNMATGVVMWVLNPGPTVDISRGRVRAGKLSIVTGQSSPYSLQEVNTLTGAVVSTLAETVLIPAPQASDDNLGIVVVNIGHAGTTQWETFGPSTPAGSITPASVYMVPAVLGFNYISQGQILRPIGPQESGTHTGPSLGMTRRAHMYAALFTNTQGVKVGTDFTKMKVASLVTAGRTQELPKNVLFTDVVQGTLNDTASFHAMWAWQTDRPYPTTVASVEINLEGEDR